MVDFVLLLFSLLLDSLFIFMYIYIQLKNAWNEKRGRQYFLNT